MTARDKLLRARGQIAFLAGLVIASAVVLAIETRQYVPVAEIPPAPPLARPESPEVRARWEYVERNYIPQTGLVDAIDGSGSTTVADVGHALKAMLAAHRLGLIDGRELYQRVARALATLSRVPTDQPHAVLSTGTGEVTRLAGPVDPAPLLTALELIAWSYPANSLQALTELERWRGPSGRELPPGAAAGSVTATSGSLNDGYPARPRPSDLHGAAAVLTRAALLTRGEGS